MKLNSGHIVEYEGSRGRGEQIFGTDIELYVAASSEKEDSRVNSARSFNRTPEIILSKVED